MFWLFCLSRWSWWSCVVGSWQGARHCRDPTGSERCPTQWEASGAAGRPRHQCQAHRQRCTPDLCQLRTATDHPLAFLQIHNLLSAQLEAIWHDHLETCELLCSSAILWLSPQHSVPVTLCLYYYHRWEKICSVGIACSLSLCAFYSFCNIPQWKWLKLP